jgi:hypothetical protein
MPPTIDWAAVGDFLEALGRSNGPAVFALFPPKQGPCIHVPCNADELPTAYIEEIQQRNPTHALGLVINPPLPKSDDWGSQDAHYHRNRRTGERGSLKVWGAQQDHIAHGIAVWAECDGTLTIEAQEALPSMAGLPTPSLSVWSGGKSLHHYWVLTPGQELDRATFSNFQMRLAQALLDVAPDSRPDDALSNFNRLMRVPGGRHPATRQRSFIHHISEETFCSEELDMALPQLPTRQGPGTAPSPSAGTGFRSRWFNSLPADTQRTLAVQMLSLLPPRLEPGTGTYPQAFATLCALVHHFGSDTAVQICTEAGWHNEHWDPATKVHDIGAATIRASMGKLVGRATDEAGWRIPPGLPPFPPPDCEPYTVPPIDPSELPKDAAPAATPQPVTLGQQHCRQALEQAVDDDIAPADMELLIHDLASRSSLSPFTLRALHAAIRHQAEQVQTIEAQAAALAAPQQSPQADLTLQQILPPLTAYALQKVTQYLPYTDAAVAMAFLAGASGLTKLGTLVCGNAATQFNVPTNLYVATVASTGQKKTPLQKLAIDNPTREIRRGLAQDNTRSQQNWREQCQGMKKDERPPQPVPLYLHIQDYTGEALVAQLQALEARGQGVLVLRDELSGLFGAMNQYRSGRGSDEQQLLELFDGSPHASLRVASGDRSYGRCHVSIYGGIQPEVLGQLVKDGDSTGKWARFIFSSLPPRTKALPVTVTRQEEAEIDDANDVLQTICQTIYSMPPQIYRLDAESIAAFSAYEHAKQQEAIDARLNSQKAVKGKAAGKVLRVAGLLHILAAAEGGGTAPAFISYGTLQTAIDIIEAHDAWAFEFHERVANGDESDGISDFMRRVHVLAQRSDEPLTWQDIRARMSSRYRRGIDVALAEAAMVALEKQGLGITKETGRGTLSYHPLMDLPAG